MKKILTAFLMLLVCVGVTRSYAEEQQQNNNQPEITFDKMVYDFGTFKESASPVTCVFKFKNTGKGKLIIHQAIATCGCTTPIYPKEPIKEGESGEIKVTYNGRGKRAGAFEKVITLRTNTKTQVYRLKIKGSMIADTAE